ncbi:GNAT family N-acetyltransferase [Hymenobacter sp. B81]|uniref:GNAT family N-acetyltransferase n=1 Tax=Hymenobacter sp. B81 TaxID=3344878 RepID=UPI0037DD8913
MTEVKSIWRAVADEPLPHELLLLGDENPALLAAYLPQSQIYLLGAPRTPIGVCVLQVRREESEIMNVAIAPEHQGQGLGRRLLQHVIGEARTQAPRKLLIKTGNSAIGQLALYQQLGFELEAVHYDYFLRQYPQPIWENGIRCKHQLVLALALHDVSPSFDFDLG